ncbi:MAG: gamma-glutamyltranspeptidase / glutathione hydrolase [Actinomycetota bacterium]|jgi:gamma-glutamyltranspeptidase/glutathione hydrolase|nr:gamma-glutamyltranspeptidase / glutathione hydrolase [Actinomycetota bacterium]
MKIEGKRFARAAVATPHYLASAVGLGVLADGGNAIDAIIAANLALGVVAPYLCGYGGDLFAIVWDGRDRDATPIGFRSAGRAPGAATVEAVRSASGRDTMPVVGAHTVTVPGAVRGWFELLERFGTRSFADLCGPALQYAFEGFPVTRRGAAMFEGTRLMYEYFDREPRPSGNGTSGTFDELQACYGGAVEGARFRQPGLARTIATLRDDGPGAYYGGPIGAAIAETLQRHGGLMTAADIAAHTSAWVDPLHAPFGAVEVYELPPPTQGVSALEALRILDGYDLPVDGPDRQHLIIEAVKIALADRDEYVTDPDAMSIDPSALLADDWIAARRDAIDPKFAATLPRQPGPDGGTAYLCASDADGLLVSLIQSNFTAIGSGVHVTEWGINLQNRGSSFSLDPAHVNATAPGKLPMHTLVPTLSLREEKPWLVFGTMGGQGQIQTHAQVLTRIVVDGDDPQAAISAPRWQVDPDRWRVAIEPRFPSEWVDELSDRGHDIHRVRNYDDTMGHAHAIELTDSGYLAATDPRAEGAVLGL